MSEISRDDFEVKKVKDFFRTTKIMIRGNAPKQLALTKGDTQEKKNKNENFEYILVTYRQGTGIYNFRFKIFLNCELKRGPESFI